MCSAKAAEIEGRRVQHGGTGKPMYSRLYWITTGIRDGNFKLLRSSGIDSKKSIPLAYVAPAGRYDNPIPSRFLGLSPIDCSKILAQQLKNRAG